VILTIIDTETTGLPKHFPAGDGPEITEYCIATWDSDKPDGERVSDLIHVLVMPQHPPKPDAEGIHRTPDGFPLSFRADEWKHKKAKPWGQEDNKRIFQRLHGKHIGGSNPRFDIDRFRFEVDRFSTGGPRFEHHHRVMDLNAVGYPLYVTGKTESTGLVALAKYFEIEHDAHTSNGDVLASIAVFERLLDREIGYQRMRAFCSDLVECYSEPGEDQSLAEAAREAML
jgi:DNA polymerase III epsilon subunit-like protein